ncbi:DegT/DnrJ/EryC1/StrS family aminotransferase [Natronincola ferrireducens]|uniref:dTDP-4-amino-4,6-dideoxygalactose transaminase n=1 Tax=Natronincola ferrireducens TaxID=393762 RepID=A0A1G8X2I6_9FIRM|nr:DegT/DnrJ/EryC1/StrS family aminotransferase [Natronincola ferrireducens]SDJ84743.1 dTDP-4-amino-4,6-dideoxygalactose transaminase [Natronincola ferrireducens]
MKIPFGDMKKDYKDLKQEIDGVLQRVLDSGWFILGKEGEAFEGEFAQYCGVNYAVGCASGTEALALSLMALDISSGDEVITVNNTAVPTITAIVMAGATPVLVDIEEDTCLIDVDKIEEKITSKTKAIMPVHLYGQICDMDRINEIAERYALAVIEDACQAHGSRYKDRQAGSLGTMGCFSFYPSKNLGAYGDGGAITTDSEELYNRLMMMRNYGQRKRYYHDTKGINSRLDEIQAAILRVKLTYLEEYNNRRREIAHLYDTLITNPKVEKVGIKEYNKTNYHLYVIRVEDRERIMEFLEGEGIGTYIHYPVNIHLQKAFRYLGYDEKDFPVSQRCAKEILSLPMYPQLTDKEVEYICGKLNEI